MRALVIAAAAVAVLTLALGGLLLAALSDYPS